MERGQEYLFACSFLPPFLFGRVWLCLWRNFLHSGNFCLGSIINFFCVSQGEHQESFIIGFHGSVEPWRGMINHSGIKQLRGSCTPNTKFACFVLYLKIINTLLKNNICILKQIVQGIIKKGIEILVGQAVFKLWIKQSKNNFDCSRTARPT